MTNDFLLWSGNKIPFPELQLAIVQPRIKELSFINENDFFVATRLLTLSKESLQNDNKISLDDKSNFEILMIILENPENKEIKITLLTLLGFLFPDYKVNIEDRILLVNMEDTQNPIKIIDNTNFDSFSNIISNIFCVKDMIGEQDFNPVNEDARRIAEKIKRGRAAAARDKGQLQGSKTSIFKHYCKILCMNGYTPEEVNNMTLYQVYELCDIFKQKIIYEDWYKAKLQGAKDIDDQEHWLNLTSNNN